MSLERIIRNAIRCNQCGDEIESFHRHDFKWCSCKRVFVDGGKDYMRRGYNPGGSYTELSRTQVGLPDGRYVPAQPQPFYDWRWKFKRVMCRLGKHQPGTESEGWFCAVCLKQLREE